MATIDDVKRAIKTHQLTGNAASVHASLNAKTIERRRAAGERTNFTAMATLLDENTVNKFLRKLKAAAKATDSPFLETAVATFASDGFDFDAPPMAAMLDKLQAQGVFTKDEADVLRSIDVWHESPLEVATGTRGATATLDDVVVALDAIAAEVPPVFDRRAIVAHVNIASGKALVVVRVVEASATGEQGATLRQLASADADNDDELRPLVDLLRTIAEV